MPEENQNTNVDDNNNGGSDGAEAAGGEAAPGAQKNWYDGADAELIGHIQTKGWDDPVKAAKAHRELEKAMGGDKRIAIPSDDASAEDMATFYQKLGRPESADKYELPEAGEGVSGNKEFEGAFKNWAFEAGLNAKQTALLAGKYNEFAAEMLSDQNNISDELEVEGKAELKKAWGSEYGNQMEAAKRALEEHGVKDVSADDMVVNPALLKLVAGVGKRLMEDEHVGGDGSNTGFGMTPEQARDQKDKLLGNKEFNAAYLSGDKQKVAKINRLTEIAAGGKMNQA